MLDVVDWLRSVTRRCRFVSGADHALRLVPDLAIDGPPFVEVAGSGSGTPEVALPLACTEVLAGPVAAVVVSALDRALERSDREAVADLPPEAWRKDPLAPVLARLLLEASSVSPRATGAPVLETFRLCSWMVATGHLPPGAKASVLEERLRHLEKQVDRVQSFPCRHRGEVLQAVSWSVAARIGAAWLLANRVDPTLKPTRFHQGCLRARLALVLPASFENAQKAPELLPGFLDLPLEETTLKRVLDLVNSVILEVESRAGGQGSATPADAALRAALPLGSLASLSAEERAALLSRSPEASTLVLSRLGAFRSPRDLGALLPPEIASRLIDPTAARALIVSVAEVLLALQHWDLIASLASLIVPAATLSSPDLPNPRLLVPRGGQPIGGQAVLAIRLSELRARASDVAIRDLEPLEASATESSWRQVVQFALERGALVQELPTHALFILPGALAALDVAYEARTRLSGHLPLPLDPIRREGALEDLPPLPAGLSYGTIRGGTDGVHTAVTGDPIDEAIRLCGTGPLGGEKTDELGFQAVRIGPGSLRSESIVAAPAFVQTLRQETERSGSPFLAAARPPYPAGIHQPFRSLEVEGIREEGERMVTLLLSLGTPDGAVEIRLLPLDELVDLHRRDQATEGRKAPTTFEAVFQTEPVPEPEPAPSAAGGEDDESDLLLEAEEAFGFEIDADEDSQELQSGPFSDRLHEERLRSVPGLSEPTRSQPAQPTSPPSEDEDAPPGASGGEATGDAPPAAAMPQSDEPILGFLPPAGEEDRTIGAAVAPPPAAPARVEARVPEPKKPAAKERQVSASVHAPVLAPPRTAAPPVVQDEADPGEFDAAASEDDEVLESAAKAERHPPRSRSPDARPQASVPPQATPSTPSRRPASIQLQGHTTLPPDTEYASPSVSRPPAPPPRPSSREPVRRATAPDFKFLFKGYRVWALTDGTVVFGQRYGSHLLDVHQYSVEGDAQLAYRRFLEDKIAERFVPHTERSQVLPSTGAGDSLDWDLLADSFVRINP